MASERRDGRERRGGQSGRSEAPEARARGRAREEAQGEAVRKRALPRPLLVVAAVALVALLVVLGRFCSSVATIDVTVNGNALSLHGAKTLDTAMRESGWPVNPGDLISLDGVVLKRSAGNPFYATVNGEETLDRDRVLNNGDQIYLTDGTDIVEDYDVTEETIPCGTLVLGTGAICTFKEGTPKIVEHLTGRLSGAEVDRVKQAEERMTATWNEPDVGGDKVIALTFDRGPSVAYTNQILNVLAENDAKATFFCMGENAKANQSLVQREASEGHQVASNTFSCKINENSNKEKLLSEVRDGFQTINEALGSEYTPTNRIVRFPNALLTTDMATALYGEVDAVIGWDVDSGDWMGAGEEGIYETLMGAEPGDIFVLHDGEYDCSSTVDALRKALPKLKEAGFSFVTIDELMAYPVKSNG